MTEEDMVTLTKVASEVLGVASVSLAEQIISRAEAARQKAALEAAEEYDFDQAYGFVTPIY